MELKFLVDENCVQLTKWLRFYGFDTIDAREIRDSCVSGRAVRDDRILVTRNQEFWHMHPGLAVCLYSDDLREQIKTIFEKIDLPIESQWFSRCVLCNGKLNALTPEEIQTETQIPAKVKEYQSAFWCCDKCKKVYWEGSHFDRTQNTLKEIAQLVHVNSHRPLAEK